jgi:hypothetical protein
MYARMNTLLIEHGGDVCKDEYTCVQHAAGHGNLNMVIELLEHAPHPQDARNWALISAAWRGQMDVVEKMVALGADVTAYDYKALHHLPFDSLNSEVRMSEYLIAQMDCDDVPAACTVALQTCGSYDVETLRLLIRNGGDAGVLEIGRQMMLK